MSKTKETPVSSNSVETEMHVGLWVSLSLGKWVGNIVVIIKDAIVVA